jgi:hypothetical protein
MNSQTAIRKRERETVQDAVGCTTFTMACEGMTLSKRKSALCSSCKAAKSAEIAPNMIYKRMHH